MTKSPKISVVIPTYNRLNSLLIAIQSVLKQSHAVNSIIVVDDGSDKPIEQSTIYEFLKTQDYNPLTAIKLIRLEFNKGVSAARNAGIKWALKNDADYIALLDSDDEWLPNKIAAQISELTKTNLLVCHSNEFWIRNGEPLKQQKKHKKFGGQIFYESMASCSMSPSTVLIHKSVFLDIGYFDEQFLVCEDYELWLRLTRKYEVAFINEPLINKNGGHTDQLSMRFKGMDYFRILALKKIKKLHNAELSTEDHAQIDGWIQKRSQWLGKHFYDMSQGRMTLRNP